MISVVIPMHNAEAYIKECIGRIKKSEYKDYEIIVVDDFSSDNSAKIAEDEGCKLIRFQVCKGPSAARNAGADVAKGDILFFIDSDIFIAENTLALIKESYGSFSDIAGVVGIYSLEKDYPNFATKYKNFYVHYEAYSKPDFISDFRSAVFAIKKDIFKEISGFDASMDTSPCEDWEFSLRVLGKNLKFHLNRNMAVRHAKEFNMISLIKGDFNRVHNFIKLSYKKKNIAREYYANSFFKSFVTPVIELILPGFSLSCFALAVFFSPVFFLLSSVLFLFLFFILEIPFILYSNQRYGILFTLQSFCFKYFEMVICEIAVFLGFLRRSKA